MIEDGKMAKNLAVFEIVTEKRESDFRDLIAKFWGISIELFFTRCPEKACESRLTCLLSWTASSESIDVLVHCTSMPLPPSPPVIVRILGQPREQPKAKVFYFCSPENMTELIKSSPPISFFYFRKTSYSQVLGLELGQWASSVKSSQVGWRRWNHPLPSWGHSSSGGGFFKLFCRWSQWRVKMIFFEKRFFRFFPIVLDGRVYTAAEGVLNGTVRGLVLEVGVLPLPPKKRARNT